NLSRELEQRFDEAYRKANSLFCLVQGEPTEKAFAVDIEKSKTVSHLRKFLVCSKAELLAYNNRPNKHGSPRRPKNAFFIFTIEYRKRMEVGLYSSTTTQSRDIIRMPGVAEVKRRGEARPRSGSRRGGKE
ncbi:8863_t:CDS:1, partial [Paraglomus occultum]